MYGYNSYLENVDQKYPRIRVSTDLKSTIEHLQKEMNANTNEKVLWELIHFWRKGHPKYIDIQKEPQPLPVE